MITLSVRDETIVFIDVCMEYSDKNQVTFELGHDCPLNGKIHSLINSYINHLTIALSHISWIFSVAFE